MNVPKSHNSNFRHRKSTCNKKETGFQYPRPTLSIGTITVLSLLELAQIRISCPGWTHQTCIFYGDGIFAAAGPTLQGVLVRRCSSGIVKKACPDINSARIRFYGEQDGESNKQQKQRTHGIKGERGHHLHGCVLRRSLASPQVDWSILWLLQHQNAFRINQS
jgi:hypothetical protein